MKICSTCKKEKDESEFNKNKARKDGLNTLCRECSNSRSKKYYNDNREHHKNIVTIRNKKIIERNKEYVSNYLNNHPCVDCGNNNPIVLDFDHVRGTKVADVKLMVHNGCSVEMIQDEINKCEVRCANCHRIITHERRQHSSIAQLARVPDS